MATSRTELSSYQAALHRLRVAYVEMPGLQLTVPQAARLFGVERPACEQALRDLARAGFLGQRANGSFSRRDG